MKNVKDFSKEIKKDSKEPNRNSTETITIRVTKDEKKRFKRLAKACKLNQTQLFKKLIQGADLKAIPPAEIYEIAKDLSAIREFILEYCLEGEPVRTYVAAIQRIMNTYSSIANCSTMKEFSAQHFKNIVAILMRARRSEVGNNEDLEDQGFGKTRDRIRAQSRKDIVQ